MWEDDVSPYGWILLTRSVLLLFFKNFKTLGESKNNKCLRNKELDQAMPPKMGDAEGKLGSEERFPLSAGQSCPSEIRLVCGSVSWYKMWWNRLELPSMGRL